MANNSNQILTPFGQDGYTLSNPGNSFVSQWLDKRSAVHVSISLVFAGAGTPDGYAVLETSNSPEARNGLFGFGANGNPPIDTNQFPGSSQNITATGVTTWEALISARWVRVHYFSTVDSANLIVYVWANSPFESA